MADVLQTSLSALLASQRALATTGHNIANVNTPGYSRQRVELSTRQPDIFGNGAIGTGVQVDNITRYYDQFLAAGTRDTRSEFNRLDTLHSLSSRVDTLLSGQTTGIAPTLQSFFSALEDVGNDPSSLPAREALLGNASALAGRFQSLAGQFDGMDQELAQRTRFTVGEIDRMAASIARINDDIRSASSVSGNAPNDLLDERDRLVDDLSSLVSVTTSTQDDGTLNVFVGSGQALVVGTKASNLSIAADEFDPSGARIMLDGGGTPADVTAQLSGGALGGLMEFQRDVLDPARNEIGRVALAFAATVNAQHASGMDMNGNLGGDFFSFADPLAVPSSANSGSATGSAQVTDIGALTSSDYELAFASGAWTVSSVPDGNAVPTSGSGTAGDPLVFDGLSVSFSGAPAAGDSFRLAPTADAASSLTLAVSRAQDVAAAGALRSAPLSSNTGDATISQPDVVDPANPALLDPVTIEFTSASTYSINGSGSFAYTPGETIAVNGATFDITGTPAAGDRFDIESNIGGVGDNRNALALSGLINEGVLDGGSASIGTSLNQALAGVSSATRFAGNGVQAQGVLLEQAEAQQLSVSGVNLDEEAANMLRYQQAYEAAAQMIQVADSMFSSLLNAVRR